MNVTFATSSHEVGGPSRRAGAATSAPIVVGDGSWIGAGAVILPGVNIGAGAIIAAGAVVAKDVKAHSLYAGVPARKIRSLSTAEVPAV
ncbi:DapH/DapD/GlmU-related protein [Arthrobacter sp. StoSoilB5]|uniref:DapH/DapD/GlmU-related protein n=1 Tax=Arthrobacter sp. StoSoilB5 TaxID=2830992 RepID=UPI0023DF866C|nr:DapH/DapD/GlmU-related protein [Arthrobacter sp. StoSoilB5]